ncbi:MAG TPA: glycosyltransferase family 39 protein [Bryobacteraceae bacterium]|nr:glycosyltransferase family 39 protein [Bryobacteraceae bacterium]
MRRRFLCVVLLALACLLIRAARIGAAGDYLDGIARISAQDEVFYIHTAITMVNQGDWLTPRFMGRYSFYKPPLFLWMAAASARLFGISRVALRFPLALICAASVGLVFLAGARIRSWQAGCAAALLVISNHLWNVSAAMVLTDGLLAALDVSAMYCLLTDPKLESALSFWGFAGSIAAAILTKTVAGFVPMASFALFWVMSPREFRASVPRACGAIIAALAMASPWYLYQLTVHHRWFWTEHVLQEILGFGRGGAPQTTGESHLVFYLKRLLLVDPVLLILLLIALPLLARSLKQRSGSALLMACWLAPVLLAPFAWHYRSMTYLIPAIAPAALVGSCYSPLGRGSSYSLLSVAGVALACKLVFASQPWGLSFASGTIQAASGPLQDYCRMNRGNELFVVDLADDLYASVLPLAGLRYATVSPSMTAGMFSVLDLAGMGVAVTTEQFSHLDRWRPRFHEKLLEWGLHSDQPIGTLVVASNLQELLNLVRDRPADDFLFPAGYRTAVEDAHIPEREVMDDGLVFLLLSREHQSRSAAPAWSCRM